MTRTFEADVRVGSNLIGGRQGLAYVCNSGKIVNIMADANLVQKYSEDGYFQYDTKVKVQPERYDFGITGTLINEKGDWQIVSGGCCLSSSFTFQDHMEMLQESTLPAIQEGDIIALNLVNKKDEFILTLLYKLSKVKPHCMTLAHLIPLTDEEMEEVKQDVIRWASR